MSKELKILLKAKCIVSSCLLESFGRFGEALHEELRFGDPLWIGVRCVSWDYDPVAVMRFSNAENERL